MTITWCIEIWNMKGRIYCNFGLFFALLPPPRLTTQKIQNSEKRKKNTWRYDHFTHVDHKWQSYDVWFLRFLRNRVWQTEHFVILELFLSFYPPHPNNSEKKETWRYYHMCTINNNHMMYGSWEMECDRQFWIILDHFFALLIWRSKILKKWSKTLEISPFCTSVPKIMIISYTVPEIRCMTDIIFIFHFRLFFALLPLND